MAKMLVNLYDLFIMLPLGIERMVTSSIGRRTEKSETEESEPVRAELAKTTVYMREQS